MPSHIDRPPAGVRAVSAIVITTAVVAIVTAVAPATPVAAQDELVIEKSVAAVNATALGDAAPVASVGDSITYGLAVSGSPSMAGTSVTITDAFDTSRLTFEGAEPVGCTEGDGTVSCLVTLDDAGATEVLLSFSVLPLDEGESACGAVVNEAEVTTEDGATATTEAQVQVCPPGVTAGDVAGGTPTGGPDTAMAPASAVPGTLLQVGATLIGLGAVIGLHGGHRLGASTRRPTVDASPRR